MQDLIVVGADPGINFGLAILDIDKNLLFINSVRNLGVGGACEIITKFGKPIFIATDKAKAPGTLTKIASTFHIQVWSPREDMKLETKQKILENYEKERGLELNQDSHALDALAAALSAYQSLSRTLSNIDKNLSSLGLSQYARDVKYLILSKRAKNIDEALKILKGEVKPAQQKERVEKSSDPLQKLRALERENETLKLYIKTLEERVKALEKQKERMLLEERIKTDATREKVLREREIRARDILISQLLYELKKRKETTMKLEKVVTAHDELDEILKSDNIPVVCVSKFKAEEILKKKEELNIPGDLSDFIVCFETFEPSLAAARYLTSLKPKAVILPSGASYKILEKEDLTILEGVTINKKKFWAWISKSDFQRAKAGMLKKILKIH